MESLHRKLKDRKHMQILQKEYDTEAEDGHIMKGPSD
jgi:hypothetical protein